jgi:hypothetical protein
MPLDFRRRWMYVRIRHWRGLGVVTLLCLAFANVAHASDESNLTKEQIKHFLLTAKIVGSRQSGKGVTHPWRLTLSDGTITHDASFQSIDQSQSNIQFANRDTESISSIPISTTSRPMRSLNSLALTICCPCTLSAPGRATPAR